MTTLEIHPFYQYINIDNKNLTGGFIPSSTRVLIIGTFPPKSEYTSKKEGFFYYSSHKNHLFNRFDNIFQNLPNYQKLKKTNSSNGEESYLNNRLRKEVFARREGIGFVDIFTKVRRLYEGSAKDEHLVCVENIIDNGLLSRIILNDNIQRICCVYQLAYQIIKTHLSKIANYIQTVPDSFTANGEKLLVRIDNKMFEVVLLYPATRSRHKGILKDEQYKKYIFNKNIQESSFNNRSAFNCTE